MKNFLGIAIVTLIVIAGIAFVQYRRSASEEPSITNATMLGNSSVPIVEENVSYAANVTGFYAHPEAQGQYPGVVMIHEWWGLNDQIKDMARELARQGYRVLAVDLYGGEVAETPERARELRTGINQQAATDNLQAAAAYLRVQGAQRVASLGWCFGGGQSLELALSEEPLNATVIYYGQPVTDANRLASIRWPVLGIFGAEDTSIPVENVRAFEQALNEAGIENSIHIYPGVGHAFANPSGANYAPEETRDAWQKTLEFLEKNLKGEQTT